MSMQELRDLVDKAERLCRDEWAGQQSRRLRWVLDSLRDAEGLLSCYNPDEDVTRQDDIEYEDSKEFTRLSGQAFENERDGKPTAIAFPISNKRLGVIEVIKPDADGKYSIKALGHHGFDQADFENGLPRMVTTDD